MKCPYQRYIPDDSVEPEHMTVENPCWLAWHEGYQARVEEETGFYSAYKERQ